MDPVENLRHKERLKTDRKFAAEYLNEALTRSPGDVESLRGGFVVALADIIRAEGKPVSQIATASGITRQHLYGVIRGDDRNLTLQTLISLLKELRFEIRIMPHE